MSIETAQPLVAFAEQVKAPVAIEGLSLNALRPEVLPGNRVDARLGGINAGLEIPLIPTLPASALIPTQNPGVENPAAQAVAPSSERVGVGTLDRVQAGVNRIAETPTEAGAAIDQIYLGRDGGSMMGGPDRIDAIHLGTSLASFSGLFGWLKRGGKSVARPETQLTNDLLRKLDDVKDKTIPGSPEEKIVDSAAESIFAGAYTEAKRSLSSIEKEIKGASELKAAIPSEDFPGATALRAAVDEIISDLKGDPFKLHDKIDALVSGLAFGFLPDSIRDWHTKLVKKASQTARDRAGNRGGASTGRDKQSYNDCVVQAIYALPIPALEAVRKRMSYQEFLNLVENRFGDWNVMRKGMSHQQLQQLLKAMGLKAHGRVPSREELASLVRERGAVLGSVVWFDKDVSEISSLQAVRHRHEHAIVVKDVDASGRNFTVLDSLYDHELHYKAEELGLQQLIVWTVEAEGQDSSAKLDAFLSR